MAVASLVLGILSVIVCCFTFLCIPLSVVGLVLGIVAKKRGSSGMATAGIVLNAVGLALSVILIILYIVDISWSYQLEDPYVMSHLLF